MSNCTVDNRTYTSVVVSCVPGYDGGIAQTFILEVIPSAFFPSLDIQNKIESIHYPQFRIENLPAGTEFKVLVYAVNEKGKSDKTEIRVWTMRMSTETGERRVLPKDTTEDGPLPVKVTPIVLIFMAIISVLVLMIILIGLILRARCSQSKAQKAKFVRAGGQSSTLLKDGVSGRGNNPDLIPENGEDIYLETIYISIPPTWHKIKKIIHSRSD